MNLKKIDLYGWLVCGLLTLLVVSAGFWPILESRAETAQQREALVLKRDEAKQLGVTLAAMRHRLTRVERAAAEEPLQLERVDRLNHRLGRLTDLADRAGLAIDSIEPGEPVASDYYVTVPIAVSGRGSYDAARAFLNALHSQVVDLSVAGMNLSGAATGAETEPTFSFELRWYASPRDGESQVHR